MKRNLYLAASLAIFFACSSNEEAGQAGNADSLATVADSSQVAAPQPIAFEIPSLEKAAAKYPKAQTALASLKARMQRPDLIKADEDVLALFAARDSVYNLIQYDVLESKLAETDQDSQEENDFQKKLVEELAKIGLAPVYAEGNYVGLANAPFLAEAIKAVGSPALQLYADFLVAHGSSLGSEYTYAELYPEMDMVVLGEKLRKEHAGSNFAKLIESKFFEAVTALTDVHLVGGQAIVWAASTDYYPNGTSLDNYETFANAYKGKAALAGVTAKIIANMSEFDGESPALYAVGLKLFDAQEKANRASLEALTSGKDLPHVLPVETEIGTRYLWTYRFYDKKEAAEKALELAKAMQADAKIYYISRQEGGQLRMQSDGRMPEGAQEAEAQE